MLLPAICSASFWAPGRLDRSGVDLIQVAATAALNGPQDCVDEMRARYKSRRDVLIEGLRAAGWPVDPPAGSMFAWAPIPERFQHLGSLDFSKLLLTEANVAVAPGTGFGEQGDGYVRFALVENEARTRQAIRGIKAFLKTEQPPVDLDKVRAARG